MPNIRTFNAGDLALHPTETGIDANVQAGRRITSIYSDIASDERQGGNAIADAVGSGIKAVGDAGVAYMDHQQISAGMPAAANLLLTLQQQANNITKNADPNNPSVYGKFRDEQLEPALEKFQDSFTTENSQRWAMEQTDRIREHMQHSIISDMSTMAANAVQLNLNKTANIAGNTVAQDPSSLPTVLDMIKHSTAATVASSPNITAEDASKVNGEVLQKMSEHIVKSAVQGAILKNPDAGLKMAQDPQYAQYLDGGEVNAFYKEAVRANRADATNARLDQEHQLQENSNQTMDKLLTGLYDPDPAKRPTMQQILQLKPDQITPTALKQALDITEKRTVDVPEATANKTAVGLIMGIHNRTVTSMDPAYKALGDGTIDHTRFQQVKEEFDKSTGQTGNPVAQARGDFLKQYMPIVNPNDLIRGHTEDGYKRAFQLQQFATIREGEMRSAGKDPSALYDPRSPDFIGNTPYAKASSSAQLLQSYKPGGNPAPQGENAPPRPRGAPDSATWNPQYKMYTYIKDGRLKGVQGE